MVLRGNVADEEVIKLIVHNLVILKYDPSETKENGGLG